MVRLGALCNCPARSYTASCRTFQICISLTEIVFCLPSTVETPAAPTVNFTSEATSSDVAFTCSCGSSETDIMYQVSWFVGSEVVNKTWLEGGETVGYLQASSLVVNIYQKEIKCCSVAKFILGCETALSVETCSTVTFTATVLVPYNL